MPNKPGYVRPGLVGRAKRTNTSNAAARATHKAASDGAMMRFLKLCRSLNALAGQTPANRIKAINMMAKRIAREAMERDQ